MRNDQVDWTQFDSDRYWADNYSVMRDDDRSIVVTLRDFFAGALGPDAAGRRAIDVGTGSNLYPVLAMLPFASTIDLYDASPSNLDWLRRRCATGIGTPWDPFWEVFRERSPYDRFRTVRDLDRDFRRAVSVQPGNVFQLPPGCWDLGTMFFVACSVSDEHEEFETAARTFIRCLVPGAPFAAAFMSNSRGYEVDGRRFPAVAIDETDVRDVLAPLAENLSVRPIRMDPPIRPGVGMVLAVGFAT